MLVWEMLLLLLCFVRIHLGKVMWGMNACVFQCSRNSTLDVCQIDFPVWTIYPTTILTDHMCSEKLRLLICCAHTLLDAVWVHGLLDQNIIAWKCSACIPADLAIYCSLTLCSTCQPFGTSDDGMSDVFIWQSPLWVLSVPLLKSGAWFSGPSLYNSENVCHCTLLTSQ